MFYLMLGNVLQSLLPSDYPKPIFLDTQQVEKVKELDNEVIYIQLYRDPFNWQKQTISSSNPILETSLGLTTLLGITAWDC